jgi:hypothetical protein
MPFIRPKIYDTMKRSFIAMVLVVALSQCTENEAEKIVLPKLTAIDASILSFDGYYYHIEFKGQFTDGQDPVQNIRIATGVNTTTSVNPKSLFVGKSVQSSGSNAFEVEILVTSDYIYSIAFYFVSKNSSTYSPTYGLFAHGDNILEFYRMYP